VGKPVQAAKLLKGYFYIIISAVIYGCMPLMAKFIYADGANSVTLVFLRNLLALPMLLVLALKQSKTLRVPLKALPSLAVLAFLGCSITPVLLFSSYHYMASGTATVLHFVYPALVVLGGILFLRERIVPGNLLCVVLCLVGIGLFYSPGEPLDWRGSLCALSSGLTFACYVLLLPRFRYRQVNGLLLSFYIALISSGIMLLFCLLSGQLQLPRSLTGWGLCLLFAITVTGVAVVLFQLGTFLIGAQQASILSTLEPITSVIVGILVFREPVNARTVIGSVLVITASILIALLGAKKQKPVEEPDSTVS